MYFFNESIITHNLKCLFKNTRLVNRVKTYAEEAGHDCVVDALFRVIAP